jgi:hypothetical protein
VKKENYLELLSVLMELLSVLMFLLILAAVFAVAYQRDALKQEAIDKGFAEWQIVTGTKEVEFKWKENK